MPETQDGKTLIKNSCGHEFAYRIKRDTAVKWLEQRPCPSCAGKQRKNKKQDENEKFNSPPPRDEHKELKQEPEVPESPTPKGGEFDAGWLEAASAMLPKGSVFHHALPDTLLALRADVPVWLQGPPGTSKSTMGQQCADALGLDFYPVQCHELMSRTDLFGFTDGSGNDHRTPLWDAFELGGLLLLDEVDNGNPNLLAAMNSLLSNGHAVFASSRVVTRHPDFRVIAGANTAGLGPEHGYIGRNGVDLATRDRFVTIEVPVDKELELSLAYKFSGNAEEFANCAEANEVRGLKQMQARAEQAFVKPDELTVLKAVWHVRAEVAQRFRGVVVSPRATIHCISLVQQGFTVREAIGMKLPGIDAAGRTTVLMGVMA